MYDLGGKEGCNLDASFAVCQDGINVNVTVILYLFSIENHNYTKTLRGTCIVFMKMNVWNFVTGHSCLWVISWWGGKARTAGSCLPSLCFCHVSLPGYFVA